MGEADMCGRAAEGSPSVMDELLEIVARLRAEDGCPWDRQQTLETLKPFLIEESYELIDAVDAGDPQKHKEELGDVLLQVLLQAQIRSEKGQFGFSDVAATLAEKLVRRHPHVFGGDKVSDPREVLTRWEAIKAAERKEKKQERTSMVDGIPRHLPSLMKAHQVQSRVARVGFDWPNVDGVIAKVREELEEVVEAIAAGDEDRTRDEIGDLLFAVVNLGRFRGVRAEEALGATVSRFARRFKHMEERVHAAGRQMTDCSPQELDVLWEQAKEAENASA